MFKQFVDLPGVLSRCRIEHFYTETNRRKTENEIRIHMRSLVFGNRTTHGCTSYMYIQRNPVPNTTVVPPTHVVTHYSAAKCEPITTFANLVKSRYWSLSFTLARYAVYVYICTWELGHISPLRIFSASYAALGLLCVAPLGAQWGQEGLGPTQSSHLSIIPLLFGRLRDVP